MLQRSNPYAWRALATRKRYEALQHSKECNTMRVRGSLKMVLGVMALGCLSATLAAGPSFAGEQSWLYPPEVRARPVVVVIGGGFARHYWDPRYGLCPRPPARYRLRERTDP